MMPSSARGGPRIDALVRFLFVLGLLALPFQVVTVGPLQPGHIWMLFAVGIVVMLGRLKVSAFEVAAFAAFIVLVLGLTKLQYYGRIKADEQLLKLCLIYPLFYVLGRSFGDVYKTNPLPYGFGILALLLGFEYAVQALSLPVIYKEITFGQGALHGTFIERNWLATYMFFVGYIAWLKNNDLRHSLLFVALMLAVTLLSGSKTILVAVGIALMMKSRFPLYIKALVGSAGVALYIALFGDELSGEKLAVKLNEERGLAFQEAYRLIVEHPLGYGAGFVEYHFANISTRIRGLGLGVNSVFSSPLDLMIIAGFGGLAYWLIFFAGFGLRAILLLAPIAAWSLINPMHQSEPVYLFLGFLVTWARAGVDASVPNRFPVEVEDDDVAQDGDPGEVKTPAAQPIPARSPRNA